MFSSQLLHEGPLENITVSLIHLETISKLFRDIIDFKSSHTAAHSVGVSACAEMAGFHHERMDGSGYPFRHCAENPSIGSRITMISDIIAALVDDRPLLFYQHDPVIILVTIVIFHHLNRKPV